MLTHYLISERTNHIFSVAVEMFASMGNFGVSFGFPAGFLCERFGARVTSVVATIVSTLGFILLWSTTESKEFYHGHAWIQYIYFFLAGKLCCQNVFFSYIIVSN